MADSRANIDLVFRNGLKDFEVLPPPGVWDNIQPAINVTGKKFIFPIFKVAATITVVATMSFLSYRLGVEISTSQLSELSDVKSGIFCP